MISELDRISIRVPDTTPRRVGTVSWLGFLLVSCSPRGEELKLTPAVFGHSRNDPLVGGSEMENVQDFIVYRAL